MILCDYGCGQEATHQFKNGKWCCNKSKNKCKVIRNKNSNALKISSKFLESRKIVSMKTKGLKRSEEFKKLTSKLNTGRKHSEKTKQKISIKSKGRIFSNNSKEKQRKYMLSGGAIKALKGMKKISKEELKLRNMVKELYSDCEFQYGVFNYSLDVALPNQKIAIEYDGYFHFDKPEHIEYFKNRQEKIESQGWKFYRVTIFDKFPTSEQIKNDIQELINE